MKVISLSVVTDKIEVHITCITWITSRGLPGVLLSLIHLPQNQTKCTLRPFCAQDDLHGKVSFVTIGYNSWQLSSVQKGRSLSRFPTSAKHFQTTLQ